VKFKPQRAACAHDARSSSRWSTTRLDYQRIIGMDFPLIFRSRA
jgi:hypothetical protein